MNIVNFFLKNYYSLNISGVFNLLYLFGFNKKNMYLNNFITVFEDLKIKFFLIKNLLSKDFLLKNKYLLKLKYLENGSYKGYKNYRGLPLHNQRTKTNSRTSRKIYY